MSGLPHQRLSTIIFDILKEEVGTFDFTYYFRSRLVLEDISGKNGQELISVKYMTLIIDYADSIPVTVQSDTKISLAFFDCIDKILNIL